MPGMRERCVKWEPVPGIDAPCADISVAADGAEATVRMYFSRVVGLPHKDLVLVFSGVASIRWEQESFGLNPLPQPKPKCESAQWARWAYPLLKVENSSWWASHDARQPFASEGRVHFAMGSMNHLVQLLALPTVTARWVSAAE